MGNDEHSQNVFRKARELGEDPLAYLRPDGAGVPRRLEAARHLVRRLHPDDRAAPPGRRAGARPPDDAPRATSTRATTRAGTACRARPSSRRRISSTACARSTGRSRTGSARRTTSSGSRSTSDRCSQHFAGAPGLPRARRPAQRDPAADRGRARRHLGQPRRPGLGHPDARRSGERDLRLGRRADQLRHRGRVRHRRGAVREVVAGGSARHRQGHHAVPRGHLAGHADERRAAGAAAGFRPRLGPLPRREDEQVARDDGRSARRGASDSAPIRCGCTSSRRLRSAATATSPGSGSRTATTSISRTTSATWSAASARWPRSIAAAGWCRPAARAGSPTWRARASPTTGARWTRSRSKPAPRRRSALSMRPTSTSPSTEPWALARDAANADRLSQVLFDVAEAVRIAAVLLLPIMPRSAAEILRRVGAGDRARFGSTTPLAERGRTAHDQGRRPVAASRQGG